MTGKRHIAVIILLGLGPLLGSCSGFSGYVADSWPHWAGGLPPDVPPRPGAPGYNEFIAHGQVTQGQVVQDPSDSVATVPFVAGDKPAENGAKVTTLNMPAQAAAKPAAKGPVQKTRVIPAAKPTVRTATVPTAAPADNQSSPGPGVGSGGLY